MSYVDLHCHSTASDGTLAPADVVRLANDAGLVGLSLTDHDTIGGIAEAAAEAKKLGVRFLAGIEISAEYPRPGTMHLLGYGVDTKNPALGDLTRRLIAGRGDRNVRIIERLNQLGVAITLAEVEALAGGTIGRPHFAEVLVRKGYVSSRQRAFDEYLGQGGKAYEDKETITPKRAIEMIKAAGGVAVLAHPIQLRADNDSRLETELKNLVDFGLDGIEVLHSDHNDRTIEYLAALAARWNLLSTGGSDFHGGNKPHIRFGFAATRRIPVEFMDKIEARLALG